MSEVKWIKLSIDIFNNRKVKRILSAYQDGTSIVLFWIRLICLAGELNSGGRLSFSKNEPYTPKTLAIEFSLDRNYIKKCLDIFLKFEMLTFDGNFLCICNWEKYQSLDRLEKLREENRLRKQKSRLKASGCAELQNEDSVCSADTEEQTCSYINVNEEGDSDTDETDVEDMSRDMSQQCHTMSQTDIDIDKDIDTDKDKDNIYLSANIVADIVADEESSLDVPPHNLSYKKDSKEGKRALRLMEDYNRICSNLPKLKSFSAERRRATVNVLNKFSDADILCAFKKANESSFLSGRVKPSFRANFDFIMKCENINKILEGNFSDTSPPRTVNGSPYTPHNGNVFTNILKEMQ